MEIQIKKLHPLAQLPNYAHATDAGMDIFTVEETVLAPGERKTISTGIAVALPVGYVALVWDKSGLASKHGLTCLGGVIDSGYRGEYKILMLNTSNQEYVFNAGDKIAQILIQKIEQPTIVEVDELIDGDRGDAGFGSTGK